ncbi:MAG: hypothetical protein ACRD3W_18885, partial [Terriglobales bacterium]
MPEDNAPSLGAKISDALGTYTSPVKLLQERKNKRTFGEAAADVSAGFAGSWSFITLYLVITILWCGGNLVMF